jgi:6-pyruvoyl-tetrahydropterin synthase
LDFGTVKHAFRTYLDGEYDHRLLLNETDTWANYDLPGLRKCAGDPTTENVALWIGQWALDAFPQCPTVGVTVDETHVNSASWRHG